MSYPPYITADDVTATIANGFQLQQYINESNAECQDVAERLGVRDIDDIEVNPVHYKIKRYGVAYLLMRLCQDKAGSNNVDIAENEKYLNLYTMYRREVESLRPQLSAEMFLGDISSIAERATVSGTLYHG